MTTLYYSPGACSMAPHIVLHELKIPHRTVRVVTGDDEHHADDFLAINPVGKLPALVLDDGHVLTEVAAILPYLAEVGSAPQLMPTAPVHRATAQQWLAFIASEVHPAYAMSIRPDRVVPSASPEVAELLRERGRTRFLELMALLERRFAGPFVLGDTFSVIDPYVFTMMSWARYTGIDRNALPKLRDFAREMLSRPSVLKTLRAESLINENGQPTPPAKV